VDDNHTEAVCCLFVIIVVSIVIYVQVEQQRATTSVTRTVTNLADKYPPPVQELRFVVILLLFCVVQIQFTDKVKWSYASLSTINHHSIFNYCLHN
jgi:hypothetical protein